MTDPCLLTTPQGRSIAYDRIGGRGPGVVFLHGLRSDMTGTKALALADWARQRGDAALWLEVRQSNAAGRALYAATGFAEVGLRRGYYPDQHQRRADAVVMRLPLRPERPGSAPNALD